MAAYRVPSMKYRSLGNTGLEVSILSYGASSLGSVFRSTNEEESLECVRHAIQSGINYIDTAPWYGHGKSETVLGKALQGIPRDQYYLATKVGRYLPEPENMFDFSAERTLKSIDESLGRLQVDYIDIIQVHDMEFAPNLDFIVNETLPALQKAKEAGKVRFIAVTGYPLENFRTVIDRSKVKIDTVLSYCHYSMNDSSLLEMMPYFQEQGVGVVNASPISMGLLSARGPPDWHPATQEIKDVCSQAAEYCTEARVDISKLAMHYTLREESIPTTLVSTASMKNLKTNIEAVNEKLSAKEESVLKEVMEKYMQPLGNCTWEGIEVKQYWQEIAKLKTNQK